MYPQHTLLSFISAVKINNEDYQPPSISTLIVSNKSPAIISKIKCFMIEDYIETENETGERFKISLFLKVHKVLATILSTISKSFFLYANDPFISLLSVDDFKQMLKHKRFQVTHEDEVVRALSLWIQDAKHTQDQISLLVPDINWNYVSVPCLFDLINTCPKIRQNPEFQNTFKKEVLLRFKFNEDLVKRLSEPRFCYKFLHNQINSQNEGANAEALRQAQKDEQSYMKKLVIENNLNFLPDFVQNCLAPVQVLPPQVRNPNLNLK